MDEKRLFNVVISRLLVVGFVLAVMIILMSTYARCHDGIRISRIVSVYDGDTIYVDIDGLPEVFGKNIGIRLRGIDTPEKRLPTNMPEKERACLKRMAEMAKERLFDFLYHARELHIVHPNRDKYFRLNADILADGRSAVQHMLDSPLARPYDGGTKEPWKCKEN